MSNIVKEKDENTDLIKDQKNEITEKKPLKDVLSSYLEKKQNEKSLKKVKKDFSDIKTRFNETKTSFETLRDIQETIKNAYNNLEKNEKETKNEN